MPIEGLCSQPEARWFYAFYSKVYEQLQPFFTSFEMREAGLDLACVSAGMDVLDVGAGTGTLSMQVIGRGVEARRLTLIDQSDAMLSKARAKTELADSTIILADAHVLPFESESFDRVVSSGSIYYFPQPVVAIREQMRVVRRGGVVLAMGSLQPKRRLIRLLATTFNRFPTEDEYRSWFVQAGLTDIKTIRVSNPWNSEQYAIAICGTRPAQLCHVPAAKPADISPNGREGFSGKLFYLPMRVLRFSVAMGAFAVLGPLQVRAPSLEPGQALSEPAQDARAILNLCTTAHALQLRCPADPQCRARNATA
jgi:MPBQ/MSBQ methyltransferase